MPTKYLRGTETFEAGLDRILDYTDRGFVVLSANQGWDDEKIENEAF
ncbi:MAG: hypothetical protein ABIK73_00340 [candidate division WOR-3 bacterium]